MRDYTLLLTNDLVSQFKGKPVIESLLGSVGQQLTDVGTFYDELKYKRSVNESVGNQLDSVGDIVVLSRRDAGELACIKEPTFVLSDEDYRRYLIYKIWKNTNNCTYYDIIKSFRMFWEKPLYYSEDPEIPATMVFETNELTPEDDVSKLFNAPFIKAAGVAIKIIAYTKTPMPRLTLPAIGILGRGYQCTTLPPIDADANLNDTVRITPAAQNITQTTLQEMEV